MVIRTDERRDGEIGVITLADPPANVLSCAMMNEILEALAKFQKDPRKKLIVFNGEGKHFSFGASVEEHRPGKVADMLPQFHRFMLTLLQSSVPTLAEVHGLCLGGGFELALGCTFLILDQKARIGVPEIQLGVFPPAAALLLNHRLGDHQAAEMILSGEQFNGEYSIGSRLANRVVSGKPLSEVTLEFFEQNFSLKSASSLRIAHQAARSSLLKNFKEQIGVLEELYLGPLMATHDAVEGINSFLEKRRPQWSHN